MKLERKIRYPVHIWLALLGAFLAGLAFFQPCTELFDRSLTGWELLRLDEDLLGRMENRGRAA